MLTLVGWYIPSTPNSLRTPREILDAELKAVYSSAIERLSLAVISRY